MRQAIGAVAAALCMAGAGAASAQPAQMSFFVTSVGKGEGANLGGLAGADAHCQALAVAAGAGGRTWRAYLSQQNKMGMPVVHARDRIGAGPWRNAKGEVIAASVAELHGENKLTKASALDEKGEVVKGRGDTPNQHDVLTGSTMEGQVVPGDADATCGNWTLSGTSGAAMVGHSDRTGLNESSEAKSWNASHMTRGGCSQDALRGTGGAGLLYCFAIN